MSTVFSFMAELFFIVAGLSVLIAALIFMGSTGYLLIMGWTRWLRDKLGIEYEEEDDIYVR